MQYIAVILLSFIYLFYYSNQTLMNKVVAKKYGSINIASVGEETEFFPIGFALGSMTFQEGSRSVSMASYA